MNAETRLVKLARCETIHFCAIASLKTPSKTLGWGYTSKGHKVMVDKKSVAEIEQFVHYFVQLGVYYKLDQLEDVYHKDMQVFLLDDSDQLTITDKKGFIGLFKKKRDAGEPPLNDWLKIHHIEPKNDSALVIMSRENSLSGRNMRLKLGIDLVYEEGRWQVIREVIFIEPEPTNT
ncbi:hypothetical protein [Microbulbifer epialgicus]|uniref:Lumazine-binding n=1 Tax=Microbulbifer epialgicus TaxID=393907 RepID=A0ABV4P5U6_9GAMM